MKCHYYKCFKLSKDPLLSWSSNITIDGEVKQNVELSPNKKFASYVYYDVNWIEFIKDTDLPIYLLYQLIHQIIFSMGHFTSNECVNRKEEEIKSVSCTPTVHTHVHIKNIQNTGYKHIDYTTVNTSK